MKDLIWIMPLVALCGAYVFTYLYIWKNKEAKHRKLELEVDSLLSKVLGAEKERSVIAGERSRAECTTDHVETKEGLKDPESWVRNASSSTPKAQMLDITEVQQLFQSTIVDLSDFEPGKLGKKENSYFAYKSLAGVKVEMKPATKRGVALQIERLRSKNKLDRFDSMNTGLLYVESGNIDFDNKDIGIKKNQAKDISSMQKA